MLSVFLICSVIILPVVFCELIFPSVTLEAYTPSGIRVSIPDIKGTTQFTFRGTRVGTQNKLNPNEIDGTVHAPINNRWTYLNPNISLQVGNVLYCWAEIYNNGQLYLKDVEWRVDELLESKDWCSSSGTEVGGERKYCKDEPLLIDQFDEGVLNNTIWTQSHFIPTEPDYEFCSYQIDNETCYIEKNQLILRPKLMTDVGNTLDLRDRCTSKVENECLMLRESGFILPPVVSSKIFYKVPFKYGIIEIKAKLPCGDWLYPEIYLQSVNNPSKKILIAYSRGNRYYYCNNIDIGGTRLFGGPMLNSEEPERSKFLSSTKSRKHLCRAFHTYFVIWKRDEIHLYVDDLHYGEYNSNITSSFDEPMSLVLGVGVGGVNDFPDNCIIPDSVDKPWNNIERFVLKKFNNAKNSWYPTWSAGNSLKVEYVKISTV